MRQLRSGKGPEGSAVPGTCALQVPRHGELGVLRGVALLPEGVLCILWLFQNVCVDVGSRGKHCLVDPATAWQVIVRLLK